MQRFLIAVCLLLPSAAFAQVAAPTTVDLAPVLNPIVQALGAAFMTIVTGILIPLAWQWYRKKAKELELEGLKIEEQYRSVIDMGAKNAIGGALGKITIPEGKLTVDVKNAVVADAANTLAKNFPDAFKQLGVENTVEKATEVVKSRLGLMDAEAAGKPVPNPSQPVAVPAAPAVDPIKR